MRIVTGAIALFQVRPAETCQAIERQHFPFGNVNFDAEDDAWLLIHLKESAPKEIRRADL